MKPERRYAGEIRVSGRILSGPALVYGDTSPSHRERFLPGAFGDAVSGAPVALNLQHDPERVIARNGDGLTLYDSPRSLDIRATLREGSAELALVRRRALRGLSIEFSAEQESRSGGVRVVERAHLLGIGLVDAGSYPGSTVELRARSGRTIEAEIPPDTDLACECSGAGCTFARFAQAALSEMLTAAFEEVGAGHLVAAFNSYANPIGSASRGTVRRTSEFGVAIDIPDSEAGRRVLAAHDDAGIVVRPFIAPGDAGEIQPRTTADRIEALSKIGRRATVENVRVYNTAPELRGLIISSTDRREGWPEPRIVATPGIDLEPRSRRTRRWQ